MNAAVKTDLHKYRPWLLFALALWFMLFSLYLGNRPIRREKRELGITIDSCEVVRYERTDGRDSNTYMHLDNITDFRMKTDDWTPFSCDLSASDETMAAVMETRGLAEVFSGIANTENGFWYFRDRSPAGCTLYNFTVAVYDTDARELYYLEYNS